MPGPGDTAAWSAGSPIPPVSAVVSQSSGPPEFVDPELPARAPVAPVIASPVEGDWLSSICPYLRSEDGSYGSGQADAGHRCAAQDPPGSLPLAFQERYCLTERHPRCEMYKYAQEAAGAGPVPAAKLTGATTGSKRAAVSLALGSAGGDTSRRPALAIAGGIGGVVLIVLIVLVMGSCFGGPAGPGLTDDASFAPQASGEATPAPQATRAPQATPAPEATDGAPADATEPPQTAQFRILYQVQEGEALLKIAETFGVTRRSILMANEGMEDTLPYVEAGKIIVVPVSSELSIEQVEAIPGYQGPAP